MCKKGFPGYIISTLLGVFLCAPHLSYSCTVVFWNNNKQANVVARSMDLYISDQPTIIVYPRGVDRQGDVKDNPLKWKSKYGSVVITAFHSNAVSDGLNEHGLAVHLLYLDKSQYEKRDSTRPGITNSQWVQYLLDNFDNVNDLVKHSNEVQVVSAKIQNREWPLHVAIEDASGDSAILEFIDGKMHIHHGKQYTVMTNEPAYDIQLQNLTRYKLFGGKLSMPGDIDPLSRFVRASSYLKTLPAPHTEIETIAELLSVIRTTMVPFGAVDTSSSASADAWPTRWVTVSDLTQKIYYFNATTTPNIIWLDLNNLDFKAGNPILQVDPTQISLIGEVSHQLKR